MTDLCRSSLAELDASLDPQDLTQEKVMTIVHESRVELPQFTGHFDLLEQGHRLQ